MIINIGKTTYVLPVYDGFPLYDNLLGMSYMCMWRKLAYEDNKHSRPTDTPPSLFWNDTSSNLLQYNADSCTQQV